MISERLFVLAAGCIFMTLKRKSIAVPFSMRYKRLLIPIFLFFVSVVLILAWWNGATKAPSKENIPQKFVITRGTSASQIGRKLKEQGLVKSALAFKIYTQVTGTAKKVQAGQYVLAPNRNLVSIVDELLKGPQEIWVTIPEGLRREEIAQKFTDAFGLAGEQAAIFQKEFLIQG